MKKIYLTVLYIITFVFVLSVVIVRLVGGNMLLKKGSTDVSTITNIEIDMTYGKVEINSGSNYSIRYEYMNNAPEISVNNGDVKVEYNYKKQGIKKDEVRVYITIKEGENINLINANCNVLELEVNGVNADKIEIDSDVCQLDIKDSKVNQINVKNNVSNINVGNTSFNNVYFESDVCNLEIERYKFEEYNYDIKCNTGTIKINGDNYLKEYIKDNGKDKTITIKCKVSNIKLEKN